MEKLITFISKYKFETGFFTVIIVPLIINYLYRIGVNNPFFVTFWDAKDVLSYYGTLLGATATIIAVIMTIDHTNKNNQDVRKHSEKLNHRNYGLQICLDLIDVLDPIKVIRLVEKLNKENYSEANTSDVVLESFENEIETIIRSVNIEYLKFQMVYPDINNTDSTYLKAYLEEYYEIITDAKHSLIEKEGRVVLNSDPTQKLIEYFKSRKYELVAIRLRDVMFSYEVDNKTFAKRPFRH